MSQNRLTPAQRKIQMLQCADLRFFHFVISGFVNIILMFSVEYGVRVWLW